MTALWARAACATMGHPAKTVLIVDDSAAIRYELREELILHGFTVCAEAENGRKAIDQARSNHPRLIILDLSMPIMNGLDSAPELRKILPDTPIILYTAFADAVSTLDVRAKGVTTILAKTEPLATLIALAEKLVQA
jgi:DNA-binding NarL/FixJ family response regulator